MDTLHGGSEKHIIVGLALIVVLHPADKIVNALEIGFGGSWFHSVVDDVLQDIL
jgi:hypothetical protein